LNRLCKYNSVLRRAAFTSTIASARLLD